MGMFKREKAGRPKMQTVQLNELRSVILDKIHELDMRYAIHTLGHDGYSYQLEQFVKNIKVMYTGEKELTIKIEK